MHRRAFLTTAGSATLAGLAGCAQGPGSNTNDSSADGRENSISPEEDTSSSEDESDSDGESLPQPLFGVWEPPEIGGDLSIDVENVRNELTPAPVDVVVRNDADSRRELTFDGFVPVADPVGTYDDGTGTEELLVVPTYEADRSSVETLSHTKFVTEGDYSELESPLQTPPATTITLEPDEEIGGEHAIVLHHTSDTDDERKPEIGEYRFDSSIGVTGPDLDSERTVELSFEIGVEFAHGDP